MPMSPNARFGQLQLVAKSSQGPAMNIAEVLKLLASRPDAGAAAGMARYGIVAKKVYGGWSTPELKRLARQTGRDHALAQELWSSGVFEARALATMIEEPEKVSHQQMNQWARDFDNWAICDGACINVFRYTRLAHRKCVEWSTRREEFVKRAAFSLMAGLSVADKEATDEAFLSFLPLIKRAAMDERNMVRKSVNWALRQIGKRNVRLNRTALGVCNEISLLNSRAAHWIAADARRELASAAVQKRLKAAAARTSATKAAAGRKR
jgi:3-methyladenine DNA glycosylase AlkD